MNSEDDESVTYVDDETWEWLQAKLAEPPQPNPRLVELLRETRGSIMHREPGEGGDD